MPRVVDHDQRRAEIVRAAHVVLARDGVDGATMRRIARKARCTTGRITHYFADKDELLIEVLRSIHRRTRERIRSALRAPDSDSRFERVIEAALPLDSERLEEWRVWLTFWAYGLSSEALRDELRIRYDDWSALLAASTGLPPDGPETRTLVALIDGLGTRATLAPAHLEAEHHLSVTEVVRAAMLLRETQPPAR